MTRDEAVDIIAQRLGDVGATFDTQIIAEMKLQQTILEQSPQLPWFCSTRSTAVSTAVDTQTVSLPSDWLMEDDNQDQFITDSDGALTRLGKQDYGSLENADWFKSATGQESGVPEEYAINGSTMYLWPTPTEVLVLTLHYYQEQTVLSTNVENVWLKHAPDLLIAMTGMQMGAFLRDPEALQLFQPGVAVAQKRMWDQDEARRQAGLFAKMGG